MDETAAKYSNAIDKVIRLIRRQELALHSSREQLAALYELDRQDVEARKAAKITK